VTRLVKEEKLLFQKNKEEKRHKHLVVLKIALIVKTKNKSKNILINQQQTKS